jgi:hypothetical protein
MNLHFTTDSVVTIIGYLATLLTFLGVSKSVVARVLGFSRGHTSILASFGNGILSLFQHLPFVQKEESTIKEKADALLDHLKQSHLITLAQTALHAYTEEYSTLTTQQRSEIITFMMNKIPIRWPINMDEIIKAIDVAESLFKEGKSVLNLSPQVTTPTPGDLIKTPGN